MRPKVIKGILYIPMPAIDKERGIYADGMIPIDNTHPDYEYWYNLLPQKKREFLSEIPVGVTGKALKKEKKGKGVYLLFDHDVTAEGILSTINEHLNKKISDDNEPESGCFADSRGLKNRRKGWREEDEENIYMAFGCQEKTSPIDRQCKVK